MTDLENEDTDGHRCARGLIWSTLMGICLWVGVLSFIAY
jgi:hypothetical protein